MSKRRQHSNPTSAEVQQRDRNRDIGAELLEAIRRFKAGEMGAVHGPPGVLLLRCADLAPLGDLSADDLAVGKFYVGRADREGWVRVVDSSGEDFLYSEACFEVVAQNGGSDVESLGLD